MSGNEYTKGALDTIQHVREVVIEIENSPIDLLTALHMMESGARLGGKLRDSMDSCAVGANDSLRAAAPDLLAACKLWVAADKLMNELDLTAYNDACIEAHRATQAAIEKVKGRDEITTV